MNRPRNVSIPFAAGVAAFLVVSCGEGPTEVVRDVPAPQFAPPGACSPWPSCRDDGDDGDGDGGGSTSPVDVRFDSERTEDIASAASQTLEGENSAERIQVEGGYTLTYTVPEGACADDDGDDLIALFNGDPITASAEITADKDPSDGLDINDRVRVRLNDIDIGDDFRYSMRFHGLLGNENSTFHPIEDVTIDDTDSNETKVIVSEQELEVRRFKKRGKKILDTDRCFGVAYYTFYASK